MNTIGGTFSLRSKAVFDKKRTNAHSITVITVTSKWTDKHSNRVVIFTDCNRANQSSCVVVRAVACKG